MLVLEASEVLDMRLICRAGTSPEGGIVAKTLFTLLEMIQDRLVLGVKCTWTETWLGFVVVD